MGQAKNFRNSSSRMEHQTHQTGWNRNNKRGTKVKKEHRGQVQRTTPFHRYSRDCSQQLAVSLIWQLIWPFDSLFLLFFLLPFFHPSTTHTTEKNLCQIPTLPIHHHCEQLWRLWRRPLSKSRFDRPTRSISTHFICTPTLFHSWSSFLFSNCSQ